MSASNYLELEILDHIFGGGDYVRPATLYVSLHSADPGETGANELSGNGYARAAVTNNATNFPAATAGAKSNGTPIAFSAATGNWVQATHWAVFDAASAGNCLVIGALTVPKTVQTGDAPSFAAGDLDVTMD